jgi:hypothetical protein
MNFPITKMPASSRAINAWPLCAVVAAHSSMVGKQADLAAPPAALGIS